MPGVQASGLCTSFKKDLLNGVHAFGSAYRTVDTFKVAFYSIVLDATITAYTTTGELSTSGYSAGGKPIVNTVAPYLSGSSAIWTSTTDVVWTLGANSSIAGISMLLYNATAAGKNAVAFWTSGSTANTQYLPLGGTFTLQLSGYSPPYNTLVQIT